MKKVIAWSYLIFLICVATGATTYFFITNPAFAEAFTIVGGMIAGLTCYAALLFSINWAINIILEGE